MNFPDLVGSRRWLAVLVLSSTGVAWATGAVAGSSADKRMIERGAYLVRVAGCNDCHTANYMREDGAVARASWLTGADVGFSGPWGTTYASNLRLLAGGISEAQWLKRSREAMRPPMPWFNLMAMTDADLRAIYRFIRDLGPTGEPAPTYVPPGLAVTTPYIEFTPRLPAEHRAER